jgi:hypothetical protein
MLAGLGHRQAEIANTCSVARSTVGHWSTGHSRPLDAHRVILRDAYRIPLEAWIEAGDHNPTKPAVRYSA